MAGRALRDQKIRGGTAGVSSAHSALGSLLGSWARSSILQGPSSLMGPMGGREGGAGKRRRGRQGGALLDWKIRGGAAGVSPTHSALAILLGFWVWSPTFQAPTGHVAPWASEGVGGGEKKRGQRGGALWDQRIGVNGPRISPAHLGPVSLLGSWTWSSDLKGQRHS